MVFVFFGDDVVVLLIKWASLFVYVYTKEQAKGNSERHF